MSETGLIDRIAERAAQSLFLRGTDRLTAQDPAGAQRNLLASLACAPNSAVTWLNLGNALANDGDHEAALGCFHRAITLEPNSPAAHCNAGLSLMTLGRWAEGWPRYEMRFAMPGFVQRNGLKGGDERKMWRGESLHGKTILVFSEQGVGDTLMTLRYLDLLEARQPERIIIRTHATLIRLVKSSRRGWKHETVITNVEPLPPHDYLVPFLSLPYCLRNAPPLECPSGYLSIYEDDEPQTFGETPRVGLVWAGSPHHKGDAQRSIPLELFAPLFETNGVEFVSLQVGPHAQDAKPFPKLDVIPSLSDFYDTACVMKSLDLLISVDSSPCHLAGALGVPVWTLLPFAPDWRWMLKRTDTPWYDSMLLVRQETRGDWHGVIRRVKRSLDSFFPQRSAA